MNTQTKTLPEVAIDCTPTHTPGEWSSCPGQAKQRYRIETKGTGNDCEPIAECKGPDREANARLLSAAPDLLCALQTLVARIEFYSAIPEDQRPYIEQWEYTEGSSDMNEARAAIAKAKGIKEA